MKMVIAIIKPFKLDDVKEALNSIGVEGMTITEVKGYGRQKGKTEMYRDTDYSASFLPKTKIEMAIPDDKEDDVIKAIQEAAHTGRIGDGKIFVQDLNRVIRIRTGEKGEKAI